MGGEDNPIPIKAVYQYKKSAKNFGKHGQSKNPHPTCKYCGGNHKAVRAQCPAYGKSCHLCGKANHFHTVCLRGKSVTKSPRPIAAVHEIPSEPSESDDEIYAIEQIGAVKHNHKG